MATSEAEAGLAEARERRDRVWPPLLAWWRAGARDLPGRAPGTTPWGVLIAEVMSQQTPVARFAGPWREWIERWPTPQALAQASPAEVIRAWGRLGYPGRALRLREAARRIAADGGQLPSTEAALSALPGVGEYTAAAVAAFAFGRRAVVLDTNIRRVLARVFQGRALPHPSTTAAERRLAAAVLPVEAADAVTWDKAVMELGAVICRAHGPDCDACPIAAGCAWLEAGRPPDALAGRRRAQGWQGTDRQARGRIMAALRAAATSTIPLKEAKALVSDPHQADRAIGGLLHDGLAELPDPGTLRLPR